MIVILAGGRSSRMGAEKPVLEINGKPMLLRVFRRAEKIDHTIVAVSHHTPKTRQLCMEYNLEFIETSGRGYVEDVSELVKEYGEFVSVPSDVPFVTEKDFKTMGEEFKRRRLNLIGVLPVSIVPRWINPVTYRNHIITGLNAVTSRTSGEEFVVLRNPLLALNVNSKEDLENARRIATALESQTRISRNITDFLQQSFKF